jgi:hypothetical protein
MPLTNAEIKVGIVAYLDVEALNSDSSVTKPSSLATRNGPFVCFATKGQESAWVEISTQYREERLEIEKAWRKGGAGAWLSEKQYVNDGSSSYVGPKMSFVAASVGVDKFTATTRPRVSPDGTKAILEEVTSRGGPIITAGT